MNEFYYINEQNERQGPLPINTLVNLMASGVILPSTLVARGGDASWRPLSAVLADLNISAPPRSSADGYHDGMGLGKIFMLTLTKNYAKFSGRATRREYWMFQLASILLGFLFSFAFGTLSAVLMLIDNSYELVAILLPYLYPLATLIPSLGISVRRLHDAGLSGWTLLLGIIPFVGPIILLLFALRDSQRGTNAYGPSLKYPN